MSRYTEVKRYFTPPDDCLENITGASEDLAMKVMFGFTTVELQSKSGKIHYVYSYGDSTHE